MRLFRRSRRAKKSSPSRTTRRRRFAFEALERRELLWAGAELYLAYDSGPSDSDMITYDATVNGTVEWDSPDTYEATVEFDHDGDGSPEGTATAYSPGESVEYNPAWNDAVFDEYEGEVQLMYRVVEHTPEGDIENDWMDFNFTLDNVAPTVSYMSVADGDVLNEAPMQVSIEFSEAIDGDNLTEWDVFAEYAEGGRPEQTLSLTSDTTVEITFTEPLADGNYVTTMLYVTDLAGNSNNDCEYASFEVDAGPETGNNDAPWIVDFGAIQETTTWSISGQVEDDGPVAGLTINFGGILEGYSVETDSEGFFWLTLYDEEFPHSGQVVAQTVDSHGESSNVASCWVDLELV